MLLINALTFFIVAVLCFLIYRKASRLGMRLFGILIGFISVFYIASGILNMLWFFEVIKWGILDAIIVGSAFKMPVSAMLLVAFYFLTKDKKFFIFFIVFLVALFGFGMQPVNFFVTLVLLSYILVILSASHMILSKNYLREACYYAIAYSILSIALIFLIFFKNVPPIWFIPNSMLCIAYYKLFTGLEKSAETKKVEKKKENLFWVSIKYLVFIITLMAFLFLSTLAIHEIGHAVMASIAGCESKAVLYEAKILNPFTEIHCANENSRVIILLSGMLTPIVFGILMILAGGRFVRNMGLLIISLGIFMTTGDLAQLNVSMNYVILLNVFASVFMVLGITKFSVVYIRKLPPEEEGKKEIKKAQEQEKSAKKKIINHMK